MESCNHCTFSQAIIIQSVTDIGIEFSHIAVVFDSAAYCKEAYGEMLSAVFPNSVHVLCLANIVNLCTYDLVTMISLPSLSRSQEESPTYLSDFISSADVKIPPVPVSTCWNYWLSAVIYHAMRIHLYEGFYKQENSKGIAVEQI